MQSTLMRENPEPILLALGGEAGCRRISREFYARVAKDISLRPLFPGKSLRCATEEFAAFLIQFLGGDEELTQKRWWLSLRESHARFSIQEGQRLSWLAHMRATLEVLPAEAEARQALYQFLVHTSSFVIGGSSRGVPGGHQGLVRRWERQCILEDLVAAIKEGRDDEALDIVGHNVFSPTQTVGIMARMMLSGRRPLIGHAKELAKCRPELMTARFNGRTLLHHAGGSGCIEVVSTLLEAGADPDRKDSGGHTALYRVANECSRSTGPELVRMLVGAGADPNACGGVARSGPLHAAARYGRLEIARALIDCGASPDALDSKGVTPLQRASNCRRHDVAQLIRDANRYRR